MRRYLILTPIRGLKADADGTVGADRLGDDIDSLVAIGAIRATGEPDDAESDADADADADDTDFVAAFLDRFAGEPEPATAMATVLQAAMEARGWWPSKLILNVDDEAVAQVAREIERYAAVADPAGIARVRRQLLGLDEQPPGEAEEEATSEPSFSGDWAGDDRGDLPAFEAVTATDPIETLRAVAAREGVAHDADISAEDLVTAIYRRREIDPDWTPPVLDTSPADGELADAVRDAIDDGAVSEAPATARPEVSDRLTKAQLLEIAAAEGVAIETDANKAAIVHAIECARKGEAHA